MPIQLSQNDRLALERFADAKVKPNRRQKAQALLELWRGEPFDSVAKRVGIARDDLVSLIDKFVAEGLEGIGLAPPERKRSSIMKPRSHRTIEKSPGVCGGAARVVGTRIPVWQLVEARRLGATEAQILIDYPRLTAENLVDAWEYAGSHPKEIDTQIRVNQIA
jgi:uncharacterized protein (DUF433 family)